MAKFRKSIKIAPGVKVNLSKSGVSGTFGVKGASVNIGKNGAYLNTGIPGTGIYDRKKLGGGVGGTADEAEAGGDSGIFIENPSPDQTAARNKVIGVFFVLVIVIDIILSIILKGFTVLNIIFLLICGLIALGCFAPKQKKPDATDEARTAAHE